VSGVISWRWDALQTTRTTTTEEDLLAELLGRNQAREVETDRPWLRVDLELHAGVEYGKALPIPEPSAWAKWAREAIGRLQNIERLVGQEVAHETSEGNHTVLAWQGDPEIKLTCSATGELRLEAITVSAFQGIDLPRCWDDSDRQHDEDPQEQLAKMFERVKAALYAWGEVMDHLV
jgi:hypothetical protein